MEDDSRNQFDWQLMKFLIKIMRTVFYGMFWLMINIFFGLYLGWADPEASTPLLMGIFYTWLVLSAVGFVYLLWRMWRKKMPPP
ncbi:hypothetical protein [Chitinophaga rhizosphaerae]|uniref:hypothetical protein n=1 Tax=Chitinophaga rhizosphaerae TaxID=1864947 RepID=UPI000F806E3E|nr:hypothetical protein [Chitinophaga rhizosphaerae]